MAEKYGTRPSSIMGIGTAFDAFCLDQAVFAFGTAVRDAVESASASQGKTDSDRKRQMRAQRAFDKMLGIKPKFAGVPSKTPKTTPEVSGG